MDHNEAVRLQAAAKYLCGELTRGQRDEYEEHYFGCPTCAEELKTSVAFMESAKQVVREDGAQAAENNRVRNQQAGWLGWLRPAFAVPVFAALVLLMGYQNTVTIPKLKHATSEPAEIVRSSVHLFGSTRGGSDGGGPQAKLQVRRGESFMLDFDFTPSRTLSAYSWQLQDRDGRTVKAGIIAGEDTNQAVRLAVMGGVEHPGAYALVFRGNVGTTGQTASEDEVQRLTFTVEFLD